jgi:hypothetical protein
VIGATRVSLAHLSKIYVAIKLEVDGHQIKKTKNITPTKLAEKKVATEKVLLLMIITPMHTQLIKYL